MNYEDFSPEAKAGIEQFRKSLKINKFINTKSPLTKVWITNSQAVCISCILNGACGVEGLRAQEFAQSKNYWLD